jgi:cytoskeletal protein CcmA (bactofilin family)
MWGKDKVKSGLDSFLGENAFLKGELEVNGGIRLEGQFEGKIRANWLTVGKKAEVKGEAELQKATIWGRVEGKLVAQDMVEIQKTGAFEGELHTNKLSIIEGGSLEGKIFKLK